jgi:transposase
VDTTNLGREYVPGVSMSRRKRRVFTDEQKAASVEHVKRTGKTVYQAAQDLDLTETALRRWIFEAEKQVQPAEQGALSVEERAELHRLRRENQRLQQERDFLKKAAAFFAKESS